MRFISLWFKYITTQLNIQCLINVRNKKNRTDIKVRSQFVDKPLVYRKWGVEWYLLCWFSIVQNFWQATKASLLWGVAPVQVVSHLCHRIVQWLCAADCKHPCMV